MRIPCGAQVVFKTNTTKDTGQENMDPQACRHSHGLSHNSGVEMEWRVCSPSTGQLHGSKPRNTRAGLLWRRFRRPFRVKVLKLIGGTLSFPLKEEYDRVNTTLEVVDERQRQLSASRDAVGELARIDVARMVEQVSTDRWVLLGAPCLGALASHAAYPSSTC